jgi:hypothetical protein
METPRLPGRRVEDAEEQKVVSNHVDVLGTPDHATGRRHVRGSIWARRLQIQRPDMPELQRGKILCARDSTLHSRGLPARAGAETRGSTAAERVPSRRTLFLLLLLGVINLN